jgi:DNA-binding IscR family transcriptional regulator
MRAREVVPSYNIAHAEGLPEKFLLKLLLSLARIVGSLKGLSGGNLLTGPPEKITLLEVAETIEGSIRGQAPSVGQDGGVALNERLEAECEKVAQVVRSVLGRVSVKDLVGKAK